MTKLNSDNKKELKEILKSESPKVAVFTVDDGGQEVENEFDPKEFSQLGEKDLPVESGKKYQQLSLIIDAEEITGPQFEAESPEEFKELVKEVQSFLKEVL